MNKVKVGKYTYMLSDSKRKKLQTYVNGKILHFGQVGYKHFFDKSGLLDPRLNHKNKKRRDGYLKRAKGIKDKYGNLTWNNPESSNYHSIRILW